MRNYNLPLIASVLAALFGASVVLACGGDFSWEPFDDRAVTLDTMPVNSRSFAYAEAHLFPAPKDRLITEEIGYPNGPRNDDIAEAVAHAEVAGLASDQADVVVQMRAEASGDSAFKRGAVLPAAVRLYTAGAVDFHKGDSAKAIARFQAILDLPAGERRDREVWAAFMLGRLYGTNGDIAKASKSFALTRELANNGAPDPLGLGVASFGEEARLNLKHAEALQKAKKMSPQQQREYGYEIAAAVGLYGEQAAHGSKIGIDSLRWVVDEVLDDDAAVAASICDPMVQQLLVTRTLDGDGSAPDNQDPSSASKISTFVRSVQECGSKNLVAADRLAAIAYRDGDYHLAQSLASQETTPLATWVQARLAMQKGDVAEAAKYYAAASKAFPSSGDTNASDEGAKALLTLENGVLALSRGEYVDALEQLYPYAASFWGDVTHIAERVLTVDELKTFVDTHKDTQVQPAVSLANMPSPFGNEVSAYDPVEAQTQFWFPDGRGPAAHLRDLLARRLLREGRYQEALKYAPPPEAPENFLADYVQALEYAKLDKSNVDRARGWYRAATLAGVFKSGNKIMGTEDPPDNYAEPGVPYGEDGPTELHADDPFVTEGERQRFKANAPKPDFRYHYLFVGTDEAIRAANLLPPRSQAFAAVMCNATSWIMDGHLCPASASELRTSPTAYASNTPEIADPITVDQRWPDEDTARINLTCQLYQRYLKEGAVVPWATHFGRDCPQPDFASAVSFTQRQEVREARRDRQIAHYHRITVLKLAAILGCWALATWWFVRHRYV